MTLIFENDRQCAGYGEVAGAITVEESGGLGFGYDPIFWYPPAGKTFAQLTEDEKNRVSHRRRAADALLAGVRRSLV